MSRGPGYAAVLATGCGAGQLAPSAAPKTPAAGRLATGSQRQQLAVRYLVIARAGNRRPDADFGRLQGRDRNRLAAAAADLRDIAATERLFDPLLRQIGFPRGMR
ncbi:MAG: hypothetical protein ACM3ML_16765 [Micromonosporaceae bacterium]